MVFLYMRRSIALERFVHWPLLDDIPAVGVPFPEFRKESTMSITAERKQELMTEFATAKGDTGSPEVQVAILPSASRT